MLSQISEHYLSPALAKLSKCFKLSQTVAGVTLLALGNGGPDVATAIIAGSSEGDSIAIAVGSIFGAGLFVTTYTLQSVIRNAGSIQIESKTFIRDMVFYLIGCVIVLIYTAIGEINLGMAIAFILVYVIFLFIVIYQEKIKDKEQNTKPQKNQLDNVEDNIASMKRVLEGQITELIPIDQEKQCQGTLTQMFQKSQMEKKQEQTAKEQIIQTQNDQAEYKIIKKQNTAPQNKNEEEEISQDTSKDIFTEKYENLQEKFCEMGLHEKLIFLIEIPIDIIRYLVIPPADENQWNKYRAVITTITGPIVFFWCAKIDLNSGINDRGFLLFHLLLIISIAASLLVLLITNKEKPPKFMWIFSLGSFLVAVLLLGQAAQVLVDFINFFQVVTRMNKTFLGMTVLAWGNSATDYFLNSSLASIGYGVMAATGCFAGQAFNLFLGFGFAMIFYSKSENNSLSVFSGSGTLNWINNAIAISVILFTIISTIISLFCGCNLGFNYSDGKYASFLKYYYLLCLFVSIALCGADQFF
ncbi:hypothetical protein ABPG74_022215 [Tetrahymena malaccensis]